MVILLCHSGLVWMPDEIAVGNEQVMEE